MIRTMGGPFGTVRLTVMGESVLSRSAISTSVMSRWTGLAHLDLCDVLIRLPPIRAADKEVGKCCLRVCVGFRAG